MNLYSYTDWLTDWFGPIRAFFFFKIVRRIFEEKFPGFWGYFFVHRTAYPLEYWNRIASVCQSVSPSVRQSVSPSLEFEILYWTVPRLWACLGLMYIRDLFYQDNTTYILSPLIAEFNLFLYIKYWIKIYIPLIFLNSIC